MSQSNRITITDENGQEKELTILFTFESKDLNQKFVLFTDPQSENGDVYAYSYDDEGNMESVTDEDTWNMCQEVLGAYQQELEDDEEEQEA